MRQGFLSGSDDYMVKPVNVNEMVLRVGALLRRAQIPVSYTHLVNCCYVTALEALYADRA